MRVLTIASPVAPLGAGSTGGVTLHVKNTGLALRARGHSVEAVAPRGSTLDGLRVHEVEGTPQPSLATKQTTPLYPVPRNGVLAAMGRWAFANQQAYDAILNLAHDWLLYYLTEFFTTPVLHLANMTDVNDATTAEMRRISARFESRVAVMTATQGKLLRLTDPSVVGFGLDLSAYEFKQPANGILAWAGRISPEKGLEDAIAIARELNERLAVAGSIEDEAYWRSLNDSAHVDYRGFLGDEPLREFYGDARAVLQTQKWDEAFGIVTAEALACGTPVVAYARGANTELVGDGVTGFLVPPDDVMAASRAVAAIPRIDRAECRAHAERLFSLDAYGERLSTWLDRAVPRG